MSEITDEMIRAAREWLPVHVSPALARTAIEAALAVRPAPEAGIQSNCCIEDGCEPCGPFCDMQKENEEFAAAIAECEERIRQLEFAESARNLLLKGERDVAEARAGRLEKAAERILPYLTWTIGPESPGHHPTMPSAVAAFCAALQQEGESNE